MNKSELINAIAIEASISKVQAKAALEAAVKVIETALLKADKVAITGFGTFCVQQKAQRQGVNPTSGAPITIPAKSVVKFKAATSLASTVK